MRKIKITKYGEIIEEKTEQNKLSTQAGNKKCTTTDNNTNQTFKQKGSFWERVKGFFIKK